MKNNYVIGITGGLGAGKSTLLYILENTYHAKVYQADRISRSLSLAGGPAFDDIVKLFGENILMPDGNPDRNRIAHIVFEDGEKLTALENILHPAVREFLKSKAEGREGLVVLEAALPLKAGFDEICDEVWYISSDAESRINRVIETRGYTREKAEEIIASQMSDEEYRNIADFVIENDGSIEKLEAIVKERINKIEFLKEV